MLVKIIKENDTLKAIDSNGNNIPFNRIIKGQPTIYWGTAKSWYEGGYAFKLVNEKWEKIPASGFDKAANVVEIPSELPTEQQELMRFINTSYDLKPEVLKLSELKWKYLMRSIMRGKNIMMTGPSGCGKTMAAKAAIKALDRPEFYFNLGATQDPRSTLIGNTHFKKETGTTFNEALFVKAIQTPDAVILLDELSRAHPDAHNILMTVLDEGQRYLRLDEAEDSPTIKVASGVTFIATANIGNEYTATRVMDRALMDRFVIVEMDVLNEEEEISLLNYLFPNLSFKSLTSIANIVSGTRLELLGDNPRISTSISTRISVEMASIMYDGFSIEEAAEVCIYPQFDEAGGLDSERVFVKQLVQKHVKVEGIADELFMDANGNESTIEV
jgi:MoxR-like ATPase